MMDLFMTDLFYASFFRGAALEQLSVGVGAAVKNA
jgi:hypothetical protein